MKAKIRFARPLVWGSIALLAVLVVGCSPITGPDSDPPLWEEEAGKTENAEEQERTEDTESAGDAAKDTEDDEAGETGETDETEDAEETGNTEETEDTENEEETDEAENNQNTGEASGQDSKDEPGEAGNEDGGQNPGEEQGSDEGEGNAGIPPSGKLSIRIGQMKKSEGVYPDMGGIARYLLDFSAGDGKTAESLYLEAGGELAVTLDTGEWEIRAHGVLENRGGPPLAVIGGTARVTVSEGKTESVLIVPDGPAAPSGEPGFLSWKIGYPEGQVWEAFLTASIKIDENNFVPYRYFDLSAPGAKEQKASLPPGTYRLESRFLSHGANSGSAEIVHIFPGLETASRLAGISGSGFPGAAEFSSSDELKAYLDELPENTADNPYPVKFDGADLSSRGKDGETLETLYLALTRYVTLDLRGCTGTELAKASTGPTLAGRKKIVSLILPETVIAIKENAFAGYDALKSTVLPKVTAIDYAAFHDLGKLEEVLAPELTRLEDSTDSTGSARGVFYRCIALKTVYFPKLEKIAHHAFHGCTALTEVLLPKALRAGASVFGECTALKAAVLPEAAFAGGRVFYNDKSLENLVLGPVPPETEGSAHFSSGCPQKLWVPVSAVEDYRNSAFWGKMKDRIYPLAE